MPLPTGRPHISDETPGPALAVLAICSAGASALVAGSAVAYQLKHRHLVRGSKLDLEWNILLSVALVVCIAQSAVIAIQVDSGLGYPIRMLTPNDVTKFLKLEYANNLLYVGSLLLLKGVQFLLQIATTFPKPNYWIPGVIMVGMLGFFFAVAFECSSPFWKLRGNQCVSQPGLWYAFGVFDILSDVYSISTVMWVSSSLNLRSQNKIKLLIILGSKYLPAACAIARLPFIHAAYTSSNYTIALYKLGMPTQLQLHLSIVALSLGKIFRFLAFLDVGYLSSAIEPTHGKGTMNRSRAGKYGIHSKISNHSANHTNHSKKRSISDHDSSRQLVMGDYGHSTAEVEGPNSVPMRTMQNGNARQPTSLPHSRNQSGAISGRQPLGNEIVVTTQYEIRSESSQSHSKRQQQEEDLEAMRDSRGMYQSGQAI